MTNRSMNKPSPMQSLVVAGGAAALLLSSTNAFAADDPPKIWLDARPWTCANELGPFARHVQLACDAIGGACEVAPSAKQADFRAALACGDQERWTLVLEKRDGSEVLSLNLEGDREQRLRKAAIWVAHASIGEPPPRRAKPSPAPAVPDVAPEAPAPKPEEPAVVPVPAPPSRPVEIKAPSDASDAKPEQAAPKDEKRGGIAVSGLAGFTSRRSAIAGGRAYAAFPLGAGFAVAPVFNYARGLAHEERGNLLLGGAMVGWGAPFGGRWIGFSIEGGGGASLGGDHGPGPGGPMDRMGPHPHGEAHASFYGRAAGTLQIPVDFAVRPFVSVAGTHVSNQFGQPAQTAMLDVGFAWRAF